MKILPLASDSLGVRSMATFVETDVKILIDPGTALGPRRYGLPPHRLELEALDKSLEKIRKFAKKSDILIITHYHYDHYIPDEPEIYKKKVLLIKHPTENINLSQRKRAKDFLELIDDLPKSIKYADGKAFKFGNTSIKFSPAVWHGPVGSKVGKVIMVSITDGKEKLVYGSDAQGPLDENAVKWIIEENPDVLILDGPPTIFMGWKMKTSILDDSIKSEINILKNTKVKTVILEHHVVRDLKYKEKMKKVFEVAESLGKKVVNAAEFLGVEPTYLEARRKELYENF
ncbi:MAG: MBL fold metallo-hydrolase [Candidatus Aenigmarchaeota archaeon]|nr:MBL fold metallo-hydrolase [Candidatus Aenigmarchaeota archaeon]